MSDANSSKWKTTQTGSSSLENGKGKGKNADEKHAKKNSVFERLLAAPFLGRKMSKGKTAGQQTDGKQTDGKQTDGKQTGQYANNPGSARDNAQISQSLRTVDSKLASSANSANSANSSTSQALPHPLRHHPSQGPNSNPEPGPSGHSRRICAVVDGVLRVDGQEPTQVIFSNTGAP